MPLSWNQDTLIIPYIDIIMLPVYFDLYFTKFIKNLLLSIWN